MIGDKIKELVSADNLKSFDGRVIQIIIPKDALVGRISIVYGRSIFDNTLLSESLDFQQGKNLFDARDNKGDSK